MLTQIWSACTDIIFRHFGSFFALLPLYWHRKLKFGKNVKKHLEILTFYTRVPLIKITCTIDMMYGSWDMKFNRQNYFVILGHFWPFTPLTARKMKISKIKKTLEISSFYTSATKIMIIRYTVPEMWTETDVIAIHFGLYFSLLPP